MSARSSLWLLMAAMTPGCTKPNPEYCDESRPCASGVCNLATHTCDGSADAAGDGASPDASSACALAGGLIAFQTDRDGDAEISRIFADGTEYQQLTTNAWPDETPVLSPDGSKIAWLSSPAGQKRLFVMNSDGSDQHEVGAGGGDVTPRWSSDSARLVFASSADGDLDIYVVDADGSGRINLSLNTKRDLYPAWSPDDSRIVFASDRDLNPPPFPGASNQLFVMDADGTDAGPIANQRDHYSRPQWSPAATRIGAINADAQACTPTPCPPTLITTSPTGTSTISIVDNAVDFEWSPDGSRLLYATDEIVVANADGTSPMPVTSGGAVSDSGPRWSPDGSRILLWSDRDGDQELYVVNIDGTQPANITNEPGGDDSNGTWSRCPVP
jgi:Tol biopolymer transport system component